MSYLRQQIKSFGIVLLLSVILLWPPNSFAQGVCFDDATAAAIVVALEQARIAEAQLAVQAGGNEELQKQLDILQGTIKLYEDQIAVYKSMREMDAKLSDAKDKACQEQVKAATPTFMQNMQKYIVGGGIGAALLGVILMVL
jgi:hypothetical protein